MNHFDVLIIGGGVTGLSTAKHLTDAGGTRVGLVDPSIGASVSHASAGYLSGGQFDNYTRVAHAHGEEFAADLWRFGHVAFHSLCSYLASRKLTCVQGERVRLIVADDELKEARQATALQQRAGFDCTLHERAGKGADFDLFAGVTERVLAIQHEGASAAWTDADALCKALATEGTKNVFTTSARGITLRRGDHAAVEVHLGTGETISTEVVVLACHLSIGSLIPDLREALVAVADQWSEASTDQGETALGAGTFYSAHHGYEWGVVKPDGRVRLGGGRYLRKWAGIGVDRADRDERIEVHLRKQWSKTFRASLRAQAYDAASCHALLDCRPCDELPIIGPMYGEPRLLLATGFMGQGLTQGFLAGRCLASLISSGRCDELPRRLWPERLRSGLAKE